MQPKKSNMQPEATVGRFIIKAPLSQPVFTFGDSSPDQAIKMARRMKRHLREQYAREYLARSKALRNELSGSNTKAEEKLQAALDEHLNNWGEASIDLAEFSVENPMTRRLTLLFRVLEN
ncbi:hypothetical protein JX265_014011 [Neoarthrinium moseri]|uniref:Uncharacterized protein n=1 Tax=Neoarthrinium moseri TaxID=1658444 RepID=A0A9Q0AH53_9PEZI|nr:hypothetical protein JX266_014424 [Neoarthrinium moseri]KAI1839715.1 hypothetical protein JX266_014072 [Neoarthrinium moseri]KAI1846942.1 hypothetical protein JX265_014011 [Neoarthrinium moseri]